MFNANLALKLSEYTGQSSSAACDMVMKYIENKLATAATLGRKDTTISVPMFIPDCPQFQIDKMLIYIVEYLGYQGFFVHVMTSDTIYISWRYPSTTEQMTTRPKPVT